MKLINKIKEWVDYIPTWPILAIKIWVKDKKFEYKNGFKSIEVWNLSDECAKWLIPRLKYLEKHKISNPEGITFEEWGNILKEIIKGMELISGGYEKVDEKQVRKSTKLLGKWFSNLWD